MKGAFFYGPNDVRIENIDIEAQSHKDALLKTMSCSVCSYDVRTFRNGSFKVFPPVVLGHEICAKLITDYESANCNIRAGSRVSVYPVIPCLNCWYCYNKMYNLCSNLKELGSTLNGGFAEYLSVPKNLFEIGGIIPIPECISDEEACLIEPLACCINGINQIRFFDFESALILGDGPIGMMQLMLLNKFFPNVKVGVCGKVEHRLRTAEQLGANMTCLINDHEADKENIQTIQEFCGTGSPNLIFISNNSTSSINLASKLANKAGRIVIFSGIKKLNNSDKFKQPDINSNLIHYNQVSIHGSFSSVPSNMKEAMNLVYAGKIRLKSLVSKTFRLEDIENALIEAESFKGFKSVVNKF